MANFDQVIPHILKAEGGATVTNISGDAGGWTKYGITARTLSSWRGYPCGEMEIRALTEIEARAIYRAEYWNRMHLDTVVSSKLALCLMDQAVNRGVVTVIRQLQDVLTRNGQYITIIGAMDAATLAAVSRMIESVLVREFLQSCDRAYINIVKNKITALVTKGGFVDATKLAELTQSKFITGWINRVQNVEDSLTKIV